MSGDSTVAGYLSPAATPAPAEGQDLSRFLQQIVVGITGLAGELVFPRWQLEPPNYPGQNVDWAAMGVSSRSSDVFAAVIHDPVGNGADLVARHEELTVMVSFYGPNADNYADLLREGFSVAQNREAMQLVAMNLIEVGDAIALPSLVKEQWQYRVDVDFRIRRQIRRNYPILNLLSAQGTIYTDTTPQLVEPIAVPD